jgi:hypothetical protein
MHYSDSEVAIKADSALQYLKARNYYGCIGKQRCTVKSCDLGNVWGANYKSIISPS